MSMALGGLTFWKLNGCTSDSSQPTLMGVDGTLELLTSLCGVLWRLVVDGSSEELQVSLLGSCFFFKFSFLNSSDQVSEEQTKYVNYKTVVNSLPESDFT